MRIFLEKFSEEYLYPKAIFYTSFVLIASGSLYSFYADNLAFIQFSASLSGLMGAVLSSRSIIRKGFQKIVVESRHTSWGDCGQKKSKEDWNTEWDAEAKAMGSVMLFLSAGIIFIIEALEIVK
jgi:hypothetical protein